MKKFALVAALALVLGSVLPASAAFIVQKNDANGSDAFLTAYLNLARKTEVKVDNKADVFILEKNETETGFDVWAGGDVENSTFGSGNITQNLTSDVSVNDTAILLNDCACNGEPGTDPVYMDQSNGDDDAMLYAEVDIKDETKTEAKNDLEYKEITDNENSTESVLDVNDDIENSAVTTGTVGTTVTRGRVLNRSTITKNIPILGLNI